MIRTQRFSLSVTAGSVLWSYRAGGRTRTFAPPVFEIDGKDVPCALRSVRQESMRELKGGITEYVFGGSVEEQDDLELRCIFRIARENPVVRFRYELASTGGRRLTKATGRDALTYLRLDLSDFPAVKEVRFSEFREFVHAFCLSELPVDSAFDHRLSVMGPMLAATGGGCSMLVAYEHGSQVPDAFVRYELAPDRSAALRAVKGNYCVGDRLEPSSPFRSIWFHFAMVSGDEAALADAYRTFVLRHMTQNAESRKPYIFYNSWAYQERNKWWNGKAFLDSMNEERMLAEVEVAHRMGIDVFVLDTGWYEKTGDWRVSTKRFPRGLAPIKAKLDSYGMKLGLWFDNAAAASSQILGKHRDCIMSWQGQRNGPSPVWETEAAHRMCLVSRYADAFADELIRLVREVGVTYFKWDAIGQYGCDDPGHQHGSAENTQQERADSYAFRQISAMTYIVDKLCAACPDAIVDFDITEGGRSVGLGFLSAGKYFLINNGPYYPNYDIPYDWHTATTWSNIFVYPGPARTMVCRTPLEFDKWIPSVLFLTHYLPDDPAESQLVNIASLMLGQNGIWGDLLNISAEGVERFGKWLGYYKRVRDDITESAAVRYGSVGGSPEIHEKVSARTGRGLVAVFASAVGTYEYVTHRPVVGAHVHTDGLTVTRAGNHARITATFSRPGAQFALFGV